MNRSDRRLKTIQSQQLKKHPQIQMIPSAGKKTKKQSTRKISLKQSALKQHRDLYVPELNPKSKKSHQVSTDNDHKYKIIKELEILTRPEEEHNKKGQNSSNLYKNNKSLIFSQHKLTNPHQSSTLKASKVFPTSDTKAGSTAGKDKDSNTYKKGSQKGSTTKKHSKSVYNYTQLDDYPQMKGSNNKNKKMHTKQSHHNMSRQNHNKSSLTTTQQPHHVSTSSMTKRVTKSKDFLNKLLHNQDIKKKTSHFKILSNCLRSYVKDEEMRDEKVDVGQIIRLVRAFNKVEVGKMSKPLEELIGEMIGVIEEVVDKKEENVDNVKEKERKRPSVYETPQRLNKKQMDVKSSTKNKPKSFELNQHSQNPSDISKTKKIQPQDYQKDHLLGQQQNYQTSLSKDITKMQQGLEELVSESKQLKKYIHESSNKKNSKHQTLDEADKRLEIEKLKMILERQKLILERIGTEEEDSRDRDRNMEESQQSSLKYEPSEDD